MTVYVDDMYATAMGRYGRMKMSHMIADTDAELHAMADKIGVARKWFQGDHYDIAMSKRALAIEAGARPIRLRLLAFMAMNRRRGRPLGTPEEAQAAIDHQWRNAERMPPTRATPVSAESESSVSPAPAQSAVNPPDPRNPQPSRA